MALPIWHASVNCNDCHSAGYAGTPTACSACHTNNYNQTNNPGHVSLGLSTDCASCHTTNPGWTPASFGVHNTYYALTGAHTTVVCASCHTSNNYTNIPNVCAGCHINNYNQTTIPPHVTLGFATDCASCHTTNPGWSPATFSTHNTYYVLAGAHVSLACSACHQNSNYANAPTDCAGCHLTNYNQTTNPNHVSAQYPTDCASCHSQTAWVPSTFNHDGMYFPIYSGHHNNKWNTCADCHTNPSNYQVYTCTTSCHPQSSTNNSHQGISGYSYNSTACYQCHPTGSAGGKRMNIMQLNQKN